MRAGRAPQGLLGLQTVVLPSPWAPPQPSPPLLLHRALGDLSNLVGGFNKVNVAGKEGDAKAAAAQVGAGLVKGPVNEMWLAIGPRWPAPASREPGRRAEAGAGS